MRWHIPSIGAGVMRDKLLGVLENRRELREGQMLSVGAKRVIAIDWCAHTGKMLGGGRLANFANEDNNLMLSTVTKTENIDELIPVLKALAQRDNVSAKVVVIDKVPPSFDESMISKLAMTIMECLPSVEAVLQDRFHVAHNLSKHFNNADPRYSSLVILGWREATVVRDEGCMDAIDCALEKGLITKTAGSARVVKGECLSKSAIQALKDSGDYHNLFSKKAVVVPEHMKKASSLRLSVEAWADTIIDECFHPPATEGAERHPIMIKGKKLAASPEFVRKQAGNALKRILNCIPPDGMSAWVLTGEKDANGFDIYKSQFHTCGVESWNSLQPDFLAGGNVTKELATGCFLEGNAKRIVGKAVELKQQEDIGVWDPRRALRVNKWAGHGEGGGTPRLLASAPYGVAPLRTDLPKAIVIQPLGRLDARVSRPLLSEAALHRLEGAPRVKGCLPPATLLALPQLRDPQPPPLPLGYDPADYDPAQADSPTSRKRLSRHGITEPEKASPSKFARLMELLPAAAAAVTAVTAAVTSAVSSATTSATTSATGSTTGSAGSASSAATSSTAANASIAPPPPSVAPPPPSVAPPPSAATPPPPSAATPPPRTPAAAPPMPPTSAMSAGTPATAATPREPLLQAPPPMAAPTVALTLAQAPSVCSFGALNPSSCRCAHRASLPWPSLLLIASVPLPRRRSNARTLAARKQRITSGARPTLGGAPATPSGPRGRATRGMTPLARANAGATASSTTRHPSASASLAWPRRGRAPGSSSSAARSPRTAGRKSSRLAFPIIMRTRWLPPFSTIFAVLYSYTAC